jgi:hypothetical protein
MMSRAVISRRVKGVVVSTSKIMTFQYHFDSPDRSLCAIRPAQNGLMYELMLRRGARARKTGGDLAVKANSLT